MITLNYTLLMIVLLNYITRDSGTVYEFKGRGYIEFLKGGKKYICEEKEKDQTSYDECDPQEKMIQTSYS